MRFKGLLAILLLGVIVTLPAAGQETDDDASSVPQSDPAVDSQASPEDTGDPAGDAPAPEEEKKGTAIGLYVYAGVGQADVDPINTSMKTQATFLTESWVTLEENDWARAELGWRLANGKGDFRLRWNGYAESKYSATSTGKAQFVAAALPITVATDLPWWHVEIADGLLSAERRPPLWDQAIDDANNNGVADPEEVRYTDPPDLSHERAFADNLQNRVYNIDLLYGREWGGRRFSGRWWAGLRGYEYEGNLVGGAWLNVSQPGFGFTDGTTLRLLSFRQRATGWGPTGILEADFNFFNRVLQLYIQGQAAFVLEEVTADSGQFFTYVTSLGSTGSFQQPISAQLTESRDKSIWQTSGEIGLRVNLKFGLTFDVAYNVTGYLDAIMVPSQIQIADSAGQFESGAAAIWNTQDLVYEGWRAGVGFQF
jgi:hypothetical protein